MENVEELRHQRTIQLANALAILVHVADGAHGSSRVELHSLEVIIDHPMQSGSEFRQNILQILSIDTFLNLHNDGLQILHDLQAGLENRGYNFV